MGEALGVVACDGVDPDLVESRSRTGKEESGKWSRQAWSWSGARAAEERSRVEGEAGEGKGHEVDSFYVKRGPIVCLAEGGMMLIKNNNFLLHF